MSAAKNIKRFAGGFKGLGKAYPAPCMYKAHALVCT